MLFAPFLFLSFDGNRYIRFGRTLQGISKKYRAVFSILKVLTIFFTLATARSMSKPLMFYDRNRIGFPQERKNVTFLSSWQKDYELKSQNLCELEKSFSKIILKSQKSCEYGCYPYHKKEAIL